MLVKDFIEFNDLDPSIKSLLEELARGTGEGEVIPNLTEGFVYSFSIPLLEKVYAYAIENYPIPCRIIHFLNSHLPYRIYGFVAEHVVSRVKTSCGIDEPYYPSVDLKHAQQVLERADSILREINENLLPVPNKNIS